MNNNLDHKIITPRVAELVSSNNLEDLSTDTVSSCVQAKIKRNNISETRLTCCCSYDNYIICAGFSGDLIFVDKESLCVIRRDKVANSIIRCLKLLRYEMVLIISTDAGEIILYDLKQNEKQFLEYSSTSIYNIVLKNHLSFITSEKNGDIFEWQYIPKIGIFRNNRIFNAVNPVFAMDIIGNYLIAVNSFGEKYEYNFVKSKLKDSNLCHSNVFCLKGSKDNDIFYGLSNGTIIFEETGCNFVTLVGHQDAVRDLVFSANNKWMFSVSKDRTVRAWYNGIPRVITCVRDYLYQIIIDESNQCLYYVDGHGDIGSITFSEDIDLADNFDIVN